MDITTIWNTFLVFPLMNWLRLFAELIGNAGIAIILITIIIRMVLLPLTIVSSRSQKAMRDLQPRIRELQKKYGKDRQKVSEETMKLYKEHGVNPLGGCLPMLLQMPILFAFYWALRNLGGISGGHAADPNFQGAFLWIENLAKPDVFHVPGATFALPGVLPLLTGATQWVQQRMMTVPSGDDQQRQMNTIMQFMPLMIVFFGTQQWATAGLVLYWSTQNLVGIVQQYFITGWGSLLPASADAAASPKLSLPLGHSADGPGPSASESLSPSRWLASLRRWWGSSEAIPAESLPDPPRRPRSARSRRSSRQRGGRRTRGKR